MGKIRTTSISLATAALLALTAYSAATDQSAAVSISANTPSMPVTRRATDQSPLIVPGLEYEFQVETRCSEGSEPESVMLSIADTREHLPPAQLNQSSTTFLIRVPAKQIAPLQVDEFCIDETPQDSMRLTIGAVLSAQASLVCSGDGEKSITYTSTSLDLMLTCEDLAAAE